ncbi:hypothetical protein [Marinilactibacillus psychrotolerans]|uniref:hypothetical protein n=1 Tax=Marinilactibacillus psychrotolerans TaxID=191770 RepID=UPI0038890221
MKNLIYKISKKYIVLLIPIFLLACDSKPSEADGWIYDAESEGYNRISTYSESDDLTKEFLEAYEGTWVFSEDNEVAIIIEKGEIEIGLHTGYETFPAESLELKASEWAFASDNYEPSPPVYSMLIEAPTYFSDYVTSMYMYPITLDLDTISSSDYAITFVVDSGDGENTYYNMKKSEIELNETSASLSGLKEYKKDNILVEPAELYTSSQIGNLTEQFLSIHEGVWEDADFSQVLLAIDNGEIYFSYNDKDNIYRVNEFEFDSFTQDNKTYYGNALLLGPPIEYRNIISGLTLIPSSIEPEKQAEADYIFNLRVQGVNGSSIAYNMQRTDYALDNDTPAASSDKETEEENSPTESKEESYSQQEDKEYENSQVLIMEEINSEYSGDQLNSFGIQSEPTQIEEDNSFKIEFYMKDDIDFNDFKYVLSGETVTPEYAGEYSDGYNAYIIEGQFDWINQFTDYRYRFGDDYSYYIILEIKSDDDTLIFEDYTDYIP